ncbi:ras-related protein rab-11c [Anaeramoeba flamelloides]|uniref:Ras-related protein rab-11c n=1 Tax=Anaeramoeba flamelloides TaxID=1746091 RepID=A0AAV7YIR7_9EUKA|nr:ras-related protein rab-11c [Anaeramoeba flamelloides]
MSSSDEIPIEYENLFKLVIVGRSGVGKTNLLTRFCDNEFFNSPMSTIGLEFRTKKLQIKSVEVMAQIWDTAGQEKFQAIPPTTYRGSQGVILTYAINDLNSFTGLHKWYEIALQYCPTDTKFLLVGNKKDLDSDREVGFEVAEKYAKEHGMLLIETSAKSSENVELAFITLLKQIFDEKISKKNKINDENQKVKKVSNSSKVIVIQKDKPKKKIREERKNETGCC